LRVVDRAMLELSQPNLAEGEEFVQRFQILVIKRVPTR